MLITCVSTEKIKFNLENAKFLPLFCNKKTLGKE